MKAHLVFWKKYLLVLALFVVFILSFVYLNRDVFDFVTDEPDISRIIDMRPGTTYTQIIPKTDNYLKAIEIKFGTYGRVNEGILSVDLFKNEEKIQEWKINLSEVPDNAYKFFVLNHALTPKSSDELSFSMSVELNNPEESIALYGSDGGNNPIRENGTAKDYTTFFRTRQRDNGRWGNFIIWLLVVCLVLFVLILCLWDFKTIRIRDIVLYGVLLSTILRCFGTQLLKSIPSTYEIYSLREAEETRSILPGASDEFHFVTKYRHLSFVEIPVAVESTANIEVQIMNKATGEPVFTYETGEEDVFQGGPTGRQIKIYTNQMQRVEQRDYSLHLTNRDPEKDLILLIFKETNDSWNLCMRIGLESSVGFYITVICVLLMGVMLILVFGWAGKNKLSVARFFIVMAVPLLLIYNILFPSWTVPDTLVHYAECYRYSNILMGMPSEEEWLARAEDKVAFYGFQKQDPGMADYIAMADGLSLRSSDSSMVDLMHADHMNFYSIVNYLPQTIGIVIGRITELGGVATLYLAKMLIAAAYILTIYYAIKATPIGKIVFAGIALLPMPLMLATSFSYDAMVLITAFGLIASILKLKKDPMDKRSIVETCIWAFLAGSVKAGGNLILLPLLFMIPSRKNKETWKAVALVIAVGLLSLALFDVILPQKKFFQLGGEPGKLSTGYAIRNPITYISMIGQSYFKDIDALMINMGGTHLSWLEESIPSVWIVVMMILIGILSMNEKDEIRFDQRDKWVLLTIVVSGLLLVPMLLLSFTNVGAIKVEGLQGRYYLYMLPLVYYLLTKFSLYTGDKGGNVSLPYRGYRWMACISCICVYYLLRLYCTRS